MGGIVGAWAWRWVDHVARVIGLVDRAALVARCGRHGARWERELSVTLVLP